MDKDQLVTIQKLIGERLLAQLTDPNKIPRASTINAAIFTGARTTYALGRDFAAFRGLGNWREAGSTPANALILQGAVALILVAFAGVLLATSIGIIYRLGRQKIFEAVKLGETA